MPTLEMNPDLCHWNLSSPQFAMLLGQAITHKQTSSICILSQHHNNALNKYLVLSQMFP